MSASSIIAGPGAVPSRRMQVQIPPQIAVQLQNQQARIQQLEQANIALETRYKHYFAVLACLLRHHFHGEAVRFPFDMMNKVDGGLGINTIKDPITEEMVVEILTAKEYELRMRGLMEKIVEMTVPKRSPFVLNPELPERATFEAISSVCYVGGKLDGKELTFAGENVKPKNPREFSARAVKEEGKPIQPELRFTTDSAGMKVSIGLIVRMPVEAAEEPKSAETAFEFKNEECRAWHSSQNDGDRIVGRFCPQCGDSRKIENVQ